MTTTTLHIRLHLLRSFLIRQGSLAYPLRRISTALIASLLLVGGAAAYAASPTEKASPASESRSGASVKFAQIPLSFEPNQGQSDPRVQFLSRGTGYSLFLTPGEVVLDLQRRKTASLPVAADTLRMKLLGADTKAVVAGLDPLPGVVSYLIGNDPKKWHSGISTYDKVIYSQVYPGVDMVFYGNQRQLEYDFIVAPGADANRIAWQMDGAGASVNTHGDLELQAANGPASFKKPVLYQMDGAKRIPIEGAFQVAGNTVRFQIGQYDHTKTLIIDPVLSYATYLGGSGLDNIGNVVNQDGNPSQALAVDSEGSAYVVGYTFSTDFPVQSSIQGATPIKNDSRFAWVFVSKLSPDGTSLVYSTYLGGSDNDLGYAIAVDSSKSAYITGLTSSPDFPVTGGAYQTICGANWTVNNGVFTRTTSCPYFESAYVTKLTPDGTGLAYSTFLSGFQGSIGNAIAVDSTGRAYVTGYTHEACAAPPAQPAFCPFPTTADAIISGSSTGGGSPDYIFVSVFDPTGANLLYSTLYGDKNGIIPNSGAGSSGTYATGIAVDTSNNFYVTGYTNGAGLITTSSTIQPKSGPVANNGVQLLEYRGYVAKFKALNASNSSSLAYGTYLGGHQGYLNDEATGIAVDAAGNAYISGFTNSYDFPVTSGAFQKTCGLGTTECSSAFVSKLNPTASTLVWSSFLGETPALDNNAINAVGPVAVDGNGNVYVVGKTAGVYYFVDQVEPSAYTGTAQAFVSEFNSTGSKLLFSSYLGSTTGTSYNNAAGLAIDSEGDIYVAGDNSGGGLITTAGAFQPDFGGNEDGFVVKIAPHGPSNVTLAASPNPSSIGQTVTLTAVVTGPPNSSVATGQVEFKNGTGLLATVPLNATGTAVYTTSSLSAGTFSLSASYAGDTTYTPSISPAQSLTVKAAPTSTALTVSPNPALLKQPVTFTATVTPVSGTQVPRGQVLFLSGTKTLATVSLNTSGVASFVTSSLTAGAYSVTAKYVGYANFAASTSSAVPFSIQAIATTTALSASATSSFYSAGITFTAKVTPASGSTPTGTIVFEDGTATLKSVALDTTGTATLIASTLTVGTHTISAHYAGAGADGASASTALKVTVTKIATTTTLMPSATSVVSGTSVMLTAKVAPGIGSVAPTGTVNFREGNTTLGTGTLNSAGTATFSTSSLAVGRNTISASYGGSTTDSASQSVSVAIFVAKVASTTSLASSAAFASSGTGILFIATVKPASASIVPTGTVSSLDGSTKLRTDTLDGIGKAILSTSLAVGSDSVQGTYAGDVRVLASAAATEKITITAN